MSIVSGVGEEPERQSSGIELTYFAVAFDERRGMARADIMDEPKLLVQAAGKCRRWTNPSGSLHYGSIQLEDKSGYAIGNVCIWIAQELRSQFVHSVLHRGRDVQSLIALAGHVREQKHHSRLADGQEIIVITAYARSPVPGGNAEIGPVWQHRWPRHTQVGFGGFALEKQSHGRKAWRG